MRTKRLRKNPPTTTYRFNKYFMTYIKDNELRNDLIELQWVSSDLFVFIFLGFYLRVRSSSETQPQSAFLHFVSVFEDGNDINNGNETNSGTNMHTKSKTIVNLKTKPPASERWTRVRNRQRQIEHGHKIENDINIGNENENGVGNDIENDIEAGNGNQTQNEIEWYRCVPKIGNRGKRSSCT